MTIASYSDLQTALTEWCHNNSSALSARVKDFITLAEAELNAELRLRTMESDESLTLSSGSRTVALPSGFVEPIALYFNRTGSAREDLSDCYVLPDQLYVNTQSNAAKEPKYWTINGTNIEFECQADQTYSLTFRMLKSFALSDSNTTNWLLTNFPNVYLYGSLLQTIPYTRDMSPTTTQAWQKFYDNALRQAKKVAGRSKSFAKLRTDVPVRSNGGYNIRSDG